MGGGRDQDGVQDGRSSATAVLTERKGFSVCGGARTTSSYGEAGGGRRATSSYGDGRLSQRGGRKPTFDDVAH